MATARDKHRQTIGAIVGAAGLILAVLLWEAPRTSVEADVPPPRATMPDETATTTPTKPLPSTTTSVAPTTTTTPPTTTTIAPELLEVATGCPQEIVEIIAEAFAGTGVIEWAIATAWRESNCRPEVYNDEHAMGLFQLLGHKQKIADAGGDWSNPVHNARAARALYDECGKLPWSPPYGCVKP